MKLGYRDFKIGLMYFLGMLFLSLVVLGLMFLLQYNGLKRNQVNTMSTDLNAYSVNFDNELAYVTSNLLLLEDIVSNRNVLEITDGEVGFTSEADQLVLGEDLLDWIRNERIYDQIRIIDYEGNEIIRVNNNNGSPVLVEEEDLQNKASRYYFQNSIGLADNTIYFSFLDLNIENGEIEYIDGEPKEMLRIASTIYDDNDTLLGIIIVNYLAGNLFHDFDTQNVNGISFSVINDDGYFLHSENKEIEYGFMFDDKLDQTFENTYGFDILNLTDTDITELERDGMIFTSIRIDQDKIDSAISSFTQKDVDIYSDNGEILIFGNIQLSQISNYQTLRNNFLLIFSFVIVLILILSRLIDEIRFSRKERIQLLEYTSNHDLLTELPNRLKITQTIEYLTSLEESYYIMFLDLDRFKQVNDVYGHLAGDKVLKEVSERIQACIRQTDIAGRLGGDEFLVLLRDLSDESVVLRIKEKIEDAINKDFKLEEGIAQIGVSIGYSYQDGDKSVEEIIHLADERMYQEKSQKKAKYI